MHIPKKYLFGGVAVYACTSLATYQYFNARKPSHCTCSDQNDTSTSWDDQAATYDKQIGLDETMMGVKLLRWWLCRQAQGSVLEVSAGTGRNLPYYNYSHLTSLTLSDTSKQMLEHAVDRFQSKVGSAAKACVTFCLSNAMDLCREGPESQEDSGTRQKQAALVFDSTNHTAAEASKRDSSSAASFSGRLDANAEPLKFAAKQFDTVVDTFGLCCHADPVQALKEMAKVCKPGGRLLLLEHGRASYAWLNKRLDRSADAHFARWGCVWNRDIMELLEQAGLEAVSVQRWHFGTTYVISAKPSHSAS